MSSTPKTDAALRLMLDYIWQRSLIRQQRQIARKRAAANFAMDMRINDLLQRHGYQAPREARPSCPFPAQMGDEGPIVDLPVHEFVTNRLRLPIVVHDDWHTQMDWLMWLNPLCIAREEV